MGTYQAILAAKFPVLAIDYRFVNEFERTLYTVLLEVEAAKQIGYFCLYFCMLKYCFAEALVTQQMLKRRRQQWLKIQLRP